MNRDTVLMVMDEFQRVASIREQDRKREALMFAALVTGGEFQLLGKPVRARLEWLDGLPWGMTEDELHAWAEDLVAETRLHMAPPGAGSEPAPGG